MADLKKIDMIEGAGAEARPGPVHVHYTGLSNSTRWQSSPMWTRLSPVHPFRS